MWKEVRKLLLKQLGTTENPPGSNRNKFTNWYGLVGPWCAMFLSWIFSQTKVEIPKFAFTPLFAEWFKDRKRAFTDESKAKPGDVVFFDFPDSLNRIQHVGIVLENDTSRRVLKTIEGNTSSGNAGSQDDGGGVFRRERPYGSSVVVFGRPPYEKAEKDEPRWHFPKTRTYLKRGDKGADVRLMQKRLNDWSHWLAKNRDRATKFDPFRLKEDGEFGRTTERALLTFQHHEGLDDDGRAGRHTLRHLQKERGWQRKKSRERREN